MTGRPSRALAFKSSSIASHHSLGAVHRDALAVSKKLRDPGNPDDGRHAELARDDRGMRERGPALDQQARDRREERCPARIRPDGAKDLVSEIVRVVGRKDERTISETRS